MEKLFLVLKTRTELFGFFFGEKLKFTRNKFAVESSIDFQIMRQAVKGRERESRSCFPKAREKRERWGPGRVGKK